MRRLLLLLFLFGQQLAQSQSRVSLQVGDTLTYSLQQTNAKWLYVFSEQANLALSVQRKGKKQVEIDESKGTNVFEKIQIDTLKPEERVIAIWAKSYLAQAQPVTVELIETDDYLPSKMQFTKQEYLNDLAFFEQLRRTANSGLFVYRTPAQIDSIYHWARQEVEKCNSIFEFYKIIAILTSFEGSCHNYTQLPQAYEHYFPTVEVYLPMTMYYLDGKLIQDAPGLHIPLGAEIVSINGVSAKDMIQRMSKYYTTDGDSYNYKVVSAFMRGLSDKFLIEFGESLHYKITYRWKQKVQTISLPGLSKANFEHLQKNRLGHKTPYKSSEKRYYLEEVEQGLYQLSIRGFDFAMQKGDASYTAFNDFLKNTLETLNDKQAKDLIIDLRGNKGGAGMLYELVYSYLTKRPFRDSHFAYSNFNETPFPLNFMLTPYLLANQVYNADSLDQHLKVLYPIASQGKYYLKDERNPLVLPQEKTFEGQLYLLIDEDVASAGAHLASLIKSYTNAIVIGSETSGGYYEHNGHLPVEYRLPYTGILTGFSILYVCQDAQLLKDQPKGRGVLPHLVVKRNVEDFLSANDVALTIAKKEFLKRSAALKKR